MNTAEKWSNLFAACNDLMECHLAFMDEYRSRTVYDRDGYELLISLFKDESLLLLIHKSKTNKISGYVFEGPSDFIEAALDHHTPPNEETQVMQAMMRDVVMTAFTEAKEEGLVNVQ